MLKKGVFTTIDAPGASFTQVLGIKGAKIAGSYLDGNNNGNPQGFRLKRSIFTTINVPGAGATEACGVSHAGIVGFYTDMGGTHGFLATQ